jgi:ATP-binding cassette, subfamily B, multidrug efflux pump
MVEEGRHGELLAANGLYARLWRRQSGGFGLATDTLLDAVAAGQ